MSNETLSNSEAESIRTRTISQFNASLTASDILEVISVKGKGRKVEALCRIKPGREKDLPEYAKTILTAINKAHICRRYVLRDGNIVFGIHVSLEAKNADELLNIVNAMPAGVSSSTRTPLKLDPTARLLTPEEVKAQTKARPKAPNIAGPTPSPPPNFSPSIKTVSRETDSAGRPIIIREMPLPHVYRDLNVPNAKGGGAKLTGGG